MSTYSVNGKEYKTSLEGLVIGSESESDHILFLIPVDNNWDSYFDDDPKWTNPNNDRAIILYAFEDFHNKLDYVAYVTWKKGEDFSEDGELVVQLDPIDRAYIEGLLVQYWGASDLSV